MADNWWNTQLGWYYPWETPKGEGFNWGWNAPPKQGITTEGQSALAQYGGIDNILAVYNETGMYPWDPKLTETQDESYQNYITTGGAMSYEEWQAAGSPQAITPEEYNAQEAARQQALWEVETQLTPYQQWEMEMAERDREQSEQTAEIERQLLEQQLIDAESSNQNADLERKLLEQQIAQAEAEQRAQYASPEEWIQRWAYSQGGLPPTPSYLTPFTGSTAGQRLTPQMTKTASGQSLSKLTPSQLSGIQGYVDWSAGKVAGAPASGADWLAQSQAQLPRSQATKANRWGYGGV